MNNSISLVIADDHEIFRDGLALMLSKQEAVTLVGQAGDGQEPLDIIEVAGDRGLYVLLGGFHHLAA